MSEAKESDGSGGNGSELVSDVDENLAGATPQAAGTAQPDMSGMLGQAAWVMMNSVNHKHLFLADMEWLLMPPIALKQFRLWRREKIPVAYASWAYLDDAVVERIRQGGPLRLAPKEWRSGKNAWLVDFVCPFGGAAEAMRQLREETFKGHTLHTLTPQDMQPS